MERCPSCGGLVSPDAEWCGQCYAPLREPRSERSDEAVEAGDEVAEGEDRSRSPSEPPEQGPGAPPVPGPQLRPPSAEGEPAEAVWTCPVCGSENPLSAEACGRCGTPFTSLLREDEQPAIDAERARRLSYLFPGLGHIRAGSSAEGLARVVSFAWLVGALVAVVVARRGQSLGPGWVLVAAYGAAAAGLYLVTPIDAERAVEGRAPIISSRALLMGLVLLIVLTLALPFLL